MSATADAITIGVLGALLVFVTAKWLFAWVDMSTAQWMARDQEQAAAQWKRIADQYELRLMAKRTEKESGMQIKVGLSVDCRSRCHGSGIGTAYRASKGGEGPIECAVVCLGCDGTGKQEVIPSEETTERRYEGVTSALIEQ